MINTAEYYLHRIGRLGEHQKHLFLKKQNQTQGYTLFGLCIHGGEQKKQRSIPVYGNLIG